MKDSSHTARAFVGCRQDNDILSLCHCCLSANRLGRGIDWKIFLLKKVGQNFRRNSVLIHICQYCKNSVIKSSLWLLSVFIRLYVHIYYIYMCIYPCVCVCVCVSVCGFLRIQYVYIFIDLRLYLHLYLFLCLYWIPISTNGSWAYTFPSCGDCNISNQYNDNRKGKVIESIEWKNHRRIHESILLYQFISPHFQLSPTCMSQPPLVQLPIGAPRNCKEDEEGTEVQLCSDQCPADSWNFCHECLGGNFLIIFQMSWRNVIDLIAGIKNIEKIIVDFVDISLLTWMDWNCLRKCEMWHQDSLWACKCLVFVYIEMVTAQ